jgi:class 3 adenylate cyclase
VVSEATYAALGGKAQVEELEPLSVKGKSEAVRAFVLRGLDG